MPQFIGAIGKGAFVFKLKEFKVGPGEHLAELFQRAIDYATVKGVLPPVVRMSVEFMNLLSPLMMKLQTVAAGLFVYNQTPVVVDRKITGVEAYVYVWELTHPEYPAMVVGAVVKVG